MPDYSLETVRLGSFDRPKYLDPSKKARRSKKYFGNILSHPGLIFFPFYLNVSASQADSK
jgi:hypothetical protein